MHSRKYLNYQYFRGLNCHFFVSSSSCFLSLFSFFFCCYVMLDVQCWFSVQLLYVPRSHYRPTTMYFVNNVTTADTQLYSANKFNKSNWTNIMYAQVTSVKLPQHLNLKATVFWHSRLIRQSIYQYRRYHQRRRKAKTLLLEGLKTRSQL